MGNVSLTLSSHLYFYTGYSDITIFTGYSFDYDIVWVFSKESNVYVCICVYGVGKSMLPFNSKAIFWLIFLFEEISYLFYSQAFNCLDEAYPHACYKE